MKAKRPVPTTKPDRGVPPKETMGLPVEKSLLKVGSFTIFQDIVLCMPRCQGRKKCFILIEIHTDPDYFSETLQSAMRDFLVPAVGRRMAKIHARIVGEQPRSKARERPS